MDTERAMTKISEFMDLLDNKVAAQVEGIRHSRDPYGYLDWPEYEAASRRVNLAKGLVHSIAVEVDERLASGVLDEDCGLCHELYGRLRDSEERARILDPQGPRLSAAALHPWVWDVAARLWDDGHRRAAVQQAATAVFDGHLAAKLGRQSDTAGGKDLAGQAFTAKGPDVGASRLRLLGYQPGTREWTNAHEGAMHLGQGCAMYIRNRTTHSLDEPDEEVALEMLASLSLFARIVDEAVVETPANPAKMR